MTKVLLKVIMTKLGCRRPNLIQQTNLLVIKLSVTQSRSKDIVLGGSVMGLTCQDFITYISWVTIFSCEVVWVLGILQ